MAFMMHLTPHMAKAMTGALFGASHSIPLVARQTRNLSSASSSKLRHFLNTHAASSRHHNPYQTLTPIATFRHPIISLRALHSSRPFNTIPTYTRPQFTKSLTTRRMLSTLPRTVTTNSAQTQSFHTPPFLPVQPWYHKKRYTIPLLLIGVPLVLLAGPRIFSIIIFGTTMLFVSVVALATGVLVLGLTIPVVLVVTAAAFIGGIPVSEFYLRVRGLTQQGFDPREWEIVDAAESPNRFQISFEKEESEKAESGTVDTMIVRNDEGASKNHFIMNGDPEAWFKKWYLAVGNVVEEECMRREKAGNSPLPDRVVVRSKKQLFCKVEIPIDRGWIRSEMQKNGQAVPSLV